MSTTFPPVSLAASVYAGAVQCSPRACVYHRPLYPLFQEADMTPHPPLSGVGTASGTGSPTASGSGPTGHASSALSVRPCHERCPATCCATCVAQLHHTWWRVVVHMHHLLISYGPPYYGMGSLSYQLLGGCALWPGWRGQVAIRPTLFVGCGPLQPFTNLGCATAVVCLPMWGAATCPCCNPEEVILPLRGGVYSGLTPSGDCPALCGGFQSGDLSEGNLGIDMVISAASWLVPAFTARKGDIVLEEAMGLVFVVARQKEAPRFW
jgi:hypothetical protein